MTMNWNRGCEFLNKNSKIDERSKCVWMHQCIQRIKRERERERELLMTSPLDNEERSFNILATLQWRKQKMREESVRRSEEKEKNEPTGCFRCWSRRRRHARRWRESLRWTDRFAGAPWDSAPSCSADPDSASISWSETFQFLVQTTLRFWFLTGMFVCSKANERNQEELTRTHSKQRTYLYSNFRVESTPTQIKYYSTL